MTVWAVLAVIVAVLTSILALAIAFSLRRRIDALGNRPAEDE